MGISRTDVVDSDFVDALELRSSGTTVNVTTTVVSTASGTKTIVLNAAADGEGFLYSKDHPIEEGDVITLAGTTGADGTYTVATVPTDLSVTVVEVLADSTGGTATFKFPAGATTIGVDPTGFSHSSGTTVQDVLGDFDVSVGDKISKGYVDISFSPGMDESRGVVTGLPSPPVCVVGTTVRELIRVVQTGNIYHLNAYELTSDGFKYALRIVGDYWPGPGVLTVRADYMWSE